jgi:hypothetical protein
VAAPEVGRVRGGQDRRGQHVVAPVAPRRGAVGGRAGAGSGRCSGANLMHQLRP